MPVTLHYDFGTDKSLTAKVGPNLSITRATSATYVNDAGEIATATSGVARFTHDKDGNSLGLLVEEARTNICLESEDITDATAWPSPLNASPSSNQTIAPDGSTAADKHIDDSGTGTGNVMVQQNVTVSTSTAYTYSVFLKADQLSWAALQVANFTTPANSLAYFDLTNGVEGTIDANFDNSGIEDYGNGWHRCWVSFTTDASDTTGTIRIYLADADTDIVVDRDGTSSIFVWGAQLEAGKYPTSYISTTTTSVTKNSDDISAAISGEFNDDDDWTLYSEFALIGALDTVTSRVSVAFKEGAFSRAYHMASKSNQRSYIQTSRSGGNAGAVFVSSVHSAINTFYKQTSGFTENDVDHYAEGTAGTPDTLADYPTNIDAVQIGGFTGSSTLLNGIISEIAYFDEKLTDADLSDLSDGTKTIADFSGQAPAYIAIGRRTASQMRPKQRMTRTKRGTLFE